MRQIASRRALVPACLALCVLLLGSFGCSHDDGMGSDSIGAAEAELGSNEFAVIDAEDAFANLEPATLARDAEMVSPFEADGSFHRSDRHPGQPGSHLREILERFDLTTDQLEQIRALLVAFHDAARDALDGLRRVNQPIIEAANEERAAIVASFENGEIDRDEARAQLADLNRRTREAVRNNPDNEPFLQALCEARRDLFDGIRAIIADTVQTLWDEWVGAHRSLDC
jgi:Spy/CpxP family protein refolding chaperone